MKYALVTGGSRGLGRAVCLKLAAQGLPVIINYQSNAAAAEAVKAEIEAAGGMAELMPFNVADEQEVDRAFEAWTEAHPDDYIAYLVNNAGIRRDGMMFMMPTEDWKSVIQTSLDGFYYVTRRCLPAMLRKKHGGRIVNMTSLSGLKGLPGQTNYSAAKAALIGATKALALEAAARDVTVNAVAPGVIDTDMTKELPKEQILPIIPLHRYGTCDEVASVVSFLAG
ncbi:MAG: SDR family oxidoreductase, partial [Bacteroidaceae bacterium]|nr:SDR family oxidoreductase [Bacteroidaceae bacterium]